MLGAILTLANNASLGLHRRSSQKQCAWYGDSRKQGAPQKKLHFAVDFTTNHEHWALGYSDLLLSIWGTKCPKVSRITWLDRLSLTLAAKAPRFEPFKTLRRPWTRLGQSMRSHLIRSSILMFDELTSAQPNQWWSQEEVINCLMAGLWTGKSSFGWKHQSAGGRRATRRPLYSQLSVHMRIQDDMRHKRLVGPWATNVHQSELTILDAGSHIRRPAPGTTEEAVKTPASGVGRWLFHSHPEVSKSDVKVSPSRGWRRTEWWRGCRWRGGGSWWWGWPSGGVPSCDAAKVFFFQQKRRRGCFFFFFAFWGAWRGDAATSWAAFFPSSATWRDGECPGRFKLCWLKCREHFQHLLHLEVYGSNKVNEQFGGSSGGLCSCRWQAYSSLLQNQVALSKIILDDNNAEHGFLLSFGRQSQYARRR